MSNKPSGLPSLFRRMWFPVGLAALLLLMIPGFVLFAMNLFGYESQSNAWLEENLGVSHHLPIPWWGALALFLIPPSLVLLYFLKLKRKPIHVPSTFLWKKSIEDLHVNSLFQWLRNNLLLLLQLLILLAMIYAILAPRLHGSVGRGKHYILMVDNSASMSATDVSTSRLEWAKAEAIKEIDGAGDNDFGMLIVFNSRAEIRQSYTNNRSLLRQRVRDIEPTHRPTHIEEALHLADSLANPRSSTENEAVRPPDAPEGQQRTYVAPEGVHAEVHLYSDGRFPDVPEFALGNLDLRYHAAGSPGTGNVGIITFNAVRDESDPNLVQAFVRCQNYGDSAARVTCGLEVFVNGRRVKRFEKPLDMAARRKADPAEGEVARDVPGDASAVFEISELDDRSEVILQAKLSDHKDAMPLDDEAWLVLGVVRKARVLIVGRSNIVLKAFFDDDSTKAIADVSYLSADDFGNADEYRRTYLEPARNGAFDLVVFDRCAPNSEDDMPRCNTVFIGMPPPPWKAIDLKKEKNLFVKGGTSQHAIMRYLSGLHEIGIREVSRIENLPPRTPILLEGESNLALLFVLSRQSHTDVVQLFPLIDDSGSYNTNWPVQTSFPLFWRNVLYILGNVSDAATEELTPPGQPKRIRPRLGVEKIRVTDPDRKVHEVDRVAGRADFDFLGTDRIGVYLAEWGDKDGRAFAINLMDSEESNLEPRPAVRIGAERVVSGTTRPQTRELWKWVVLAAFMFLLVEWYVYNRRVYV
jgi:hypothetical protein